VCDVAPTLLWAAGAGVPADVDGRVLFEAFELAFAAAQPLREVETEPRDRDADALVASRLRALGYL
jgi:arylsulfatase A-like enzyme